MAQAIKTKILILGGGFGGLYTALELERALKSEPDVEIAGCHFMQHGCEQEEVFAIDQGDLNIRLSSHGSL